jgi:hypothetical protein
MQSISISKIDIGKRYREEMGDLKALARSIKEVGLLQPIGITEDFKLVFGERRLRACRDILKWSRIDARVVNVSSIIAGEWAENEVRKAFTASERVAIAKALEAQIPERRGRSSKVQNFVLLKGKAIDVVSKQAGFNNRETYRQAKNVVKNGCPQLVEAMDSDKVAISTAARIANLPIAEQNELLELESRALSQATRTLRRPKRREISESNNEDAIGKSNSVRDLFDELKNHRHQLEEILSSKCNGEDVVMKVVEKRQILRLLNEIKEHLESLEQAWSAERKRA